MRRETEFLDAMAARAQLRLRQTARNLRREVLLPDAASNFVRRRPWWSLGGALAAGFCGGLGLGRGKVAAPSGPATAAAPPLLATIGVRLRRVLTSAFGAMLVANLQRGAAAAVAPPEQGPPTTQPGAKQALGAVQVPAAE